MPHNMSVPEAVAALEITQMPEGYHKVPVLLTTKELERLRPALTGEGTYSAAIRNRLGWPESPYGLKRTLNRMLDERKDR